MLTAGKLAIAVMLLTSVHTYQVDAGAFKCYEDYRALTDTTSLQYQLQQEAYTDEAGLRKVGHRYCIALGSAYGSEIGTKYDIVLENGSLLPCILADQKADRDTVKGHTQDRHGAVVEFIVDTYRLPEIVRQMGDASYISPEFRGKIKEIRRAVK